MVGIRHLHKTVVAYRSKMHFILPVIWLENISIFFSFYITHANSQNVVIDKNLYDRLNLYAVVQIHQLPFSEGDRSSRP